jgi:protein TonB
MILTLRPWQISLIIHLGIILVFVMLTQINFQTELIDVPVIYEVPQEVQNLTKIEEKPQVVLKSVNKAAQDHAAKNARQIFGTSRDSHTDTSDSEGVEAKKGNTLAKISDDLVLKDTDAGALPTPTEEYLVSEMPAVVLEVIPVYPKEARDKKIEGSVVIDILIDDLGKVRDAKVLEGPEIFRNPALEAIKKFRFRPAKTENQAVAVRIRYTLNFKLEF